jgi:hypothetical protein
MEEGISQWSKFMVRLLKKIVLKALGSSLGVNQLWTKKNDHAPKNDCGDLFFIYMPEKGIFEKRIKLSHSLIFFWALLVFTSC